MKAFSVDIMVQQLFQGVFSGLGREQRTEAVDEVDDGRDGHKHKPEPNKQVDLLIEHVNHQNTLDSVTMHVGQSSNSEVTKGDSRKDRRVSPAFSRPERGQGSPAPKMETAADEVVQQNELSKDIGQIHQFGEEVQHGDIGSKRATKTETTDSSGHRPLTVHFEGFTDVGGEFVDLVFAVMATHRSELLGVRNGRVQIETLKGKGK